MINREKLAAQLELERRRYVSQHRKSMEKKAERSGVLLYNAPMNWMQQWPLEVPITVERGEKHKVIDADGNEYIDFCLGYSAAFPGHGSREVAKALHETMSGGMVYTMPSVLDAETGARLKERFGQDYWGFALSATDANRFIIKLCREITGRKKILVFNGCYHGTVFIIDEAHTITYDYRGYAKKHALKPDVLILGKCIGGGFPVGLYGVSKSIRDRIDGIIRVEYSDTSGIGGTMTGSVMAMAGIKAALTYELTESNYRKAIQNTDFIVDGLRKIIAGEKLGWSIVSLGARFDIWFAEKPGINAAEAFACHDGDLYEYVFTALVNRGYIMSPYWNILASVSPYLTEAECKEFLTAFHDVVEVLLQTDNQ